MIQENKKYRKDHEDSLIIKSFALGLFNSTFGMSMVIFDTRALGIVCSILIDVIILMQFILFIIDYRSPMKKWRKKNEHHKL